MLPVDLTQPGHIAQSSISTQASFVPGSSGRSDTVLTTIPESTSGSARQSIAFPSPQLPPPPRPQLSVNVPPAALQNMQAVQRTSLSSQESSSVGPLANRPVHPGGGLKSRAIGLPAQPRLFPAKTFSPASGTPSRSSAFVPTPF